MGKKRVVSKERLAARYREHKKNPHFAFAALEIRNLWLSMSRNKSQTFENFIKSIAYVHYLTFSKFVRTVHVNDIHSYLKAMKLNKRFPNTWANNWSYRFYLEYLDNEKSPNDSIADTTNELFDLAEQCDLTVSELIDELQLSEIIVLLQQRRISPWVILHSTKIKEKAEEAEEGLQTQFIKMFDMDAWSIRFAEHPIANQTAKKVAEELGI